MPLGNARDFGHDPHPMLPGDPENAWTDADPQFQGNIRRLEDELAAENLGQGDPGEDEGVALEDMAVYDPFETEDAEVGEYLGEPSQAELAELMNYLAAMKPEYAITPTDLAVLKNEGIITTEEAREYLVSKGIIRE